MSVSVSIPPITTVPRDAPPRRARPRCGPQRHAAQDERERSHKEGAADADGRLPARRPSGLRPRSKAMVENSTIRIAFLAASPMKYYQADLRIHVHAMSGAARPRRRRRRSRWVPSGAPRTASEPALIERCEDQEHEDQRQREGRASAPRSQPFLVGRGPPIRSPSRGRQDVLRHRLERCHGLP